MVVSAFTAFLATPIGITAAYNLHVGQFRLKRMIYGTLVASLAVPVILIAVGAYFAFIIAFDEVVIASFLSGGEGATLTNLMFASLRNEIDPTIADISTMMISVTTIPPLIGHLVLMRRRSTA